MAEAVLVTIFCLVISNRHLLSRLLLTAYFYSKEWDDNLPTLNPRERHISTCSGKTSLVRGGSKVRMKRLYPRWRTLSALRQKGYTDVYVTVRPSTFAVFSNSYDADWWRKKELLLQSRTWNWTQGPVLTCALCTQSAKIDSGVYRPELKCLD